MFNNMFTAPSSPSELEDALVYVSNAGGIPPVVDDYFDSAYGTATQYVPSMMSATGSRNTSVSAFGGDVGIGSPLFPNMSNDAMPLDLAPQYSPYDQGSAAGMFPDLYLAEGQADFDLQPHAGYATDIGAFTPPPGAMSSAPFIFGLEEHNTAYNLPAPPFDLVPDDGATFSYFDPGAFVSGHTSTSPLAVPAAPSPNPAPAVSSSSSTPTTSSTRRRRRGARSTSSVSSSGGPSLVHRDLQPGRSAITKEDVDWYATNAAPWKKGDAARACPVPGCPARVREKLRRHLMESHMPFGVACRECGGPISRNAKDTRERHSCKKKKRATPRA